MESVAKHYFYVLQCKDGSLYAGYTNNLERRVAVHNAGKGAKYTRARLPVTCVYFEEFITKREAMQQEYAFKQLTREKKEDYIGRNEQA
ncbi:GIY-YIG nuclease family protein [Metasolibacillus sp. FSL K6-0083]|uniref:GIY-YIG nuclease family protein n=1 Tax=Metasolibacillus sp. FSL K6-0083 TaxID=2921416 RepID=UPI0007984E01|nr:endonuclease [[Bacillus] sp. KCTC 13219]